MTDAPGPSAASRRAGWIAAGVGLGISVGLIAFRALGEWSSRDPREPDPTARPAVAVLPFAVDGSAHIGYLRGGLVKILSVKLDGAADLWSVGRSGSWPDNSPSPDAHLTQSAALMTRSLPDRGCRPACGSNTKG